MPPSTPWQSYVSAICGGWCVRLAANLLDVVERGIAGTNLAFKHLLVSLSEVLRQESIDDRVDRRVAVCQAVSGHSKHKWCLVQREGAKLHPQVNHVMREPGETEHHYHHQHRLGRLRYTDDKQRIGKRRGESFSQKIHMLYWSVGGSQEKRTSFWQVRTSEMLLLCSCCSAIILLFLFHLVLWNTKPVPYAVPSADYKRRLCNDCPLLVQSEMANTQLVRLNDVNLNWSAAFHHSLCGIYLLAWSLIYVDVASFTTDTQTHTLI